LSRWKKLGAKPADVPYVNFYARKLKDAGWSDGDINEAIAFGLKHQNEGWAKFEGLAIHEMHRRGIDGSIVNEALTPGDIILEQPQVRDALEAQSFAEAHAAGPQSPQTSADGRLAEIQRLMASDPDKYWQDPAMQAEFAKLVEAKEAGTPAPAAPNPRRAAIERMMAQTPDAYWGNPEIQNEFAAIVAAETPAQEAAE